MVGRALSSHALVVTYIPGHDTRSPLPYIKNGVGLEGNDKRHGSCKPRSANKLAGIEVVVGMLLGTPPSTDQCRPILEYHVEAGQGRGEKSLHSLDDCLDMLGPFAVVLLARQGGNVVHLGERGGVEEEADM